MYQANLAKKSGLALSILARYEQGKILDLNPWILEKIAKSLKIKPLELLPTDNQSEIKDLFSYFCRTDTLGSRIKYLRLKQHLQQTELARMIGVNKVTVCRYEKDQSKSDKYIIQKLSQILNTRF